MHKSILLLQKEMQVDNRFGVVLRIPLAGLNEAHSHNMKARMQVRDPSRPSGFCYPLSTKSEGNEYHLNLTLPKYVGVSNRVD